MAEEFNEKETRKAPLNASVATEEFDWDAFESEAAYEGDRNEVEKLYDQTLSKVVDNEVVEGTVT